MTAFPTLFRPALLLVLLFAGPLQAAALPMAPRGSPATEMVATEGAVRVAQGGCSAAAREAAQQSGGQVLSVQTANQGGRTVCIVTVLIPAQDGERPRRQTITIEQ